MCGKERASAEDGLRSVAGVWQDPLPGQPSPRPRTARPGTPHGRRTHPPAPRRRDRGASRGAGDPQEAFSWKMSFQYRFLLEPRRRPCAFPPLGQSRGTGPGGERRGRAGAGGGAATSAPRAARQLASDLISADCAPAAPALLPAPPAATPHRPRAHPRAGRGAPSPGGTEQGDTDLGDRSPAHSRPGPLQPAPLCGDQLPLSFVPLVPAVPLPASLSLVPWVPYVPRPPRRLPMALQLAEMGFLNSTEDVQGLWHQHGGGT